MPGPRKPRTLNRDELWDYALRSLGSKAQSASEIRQKLLRRAASPADVGSTLERLREYGFANDETFSEMFATSRLNNRGFGKERVLRDLAAKRVAKPIAEQAIQAVYGDRAESELIDDYLARKYRGKNLREILSDQKGLSQAFRRLRVAGFSSSASMAALRKHAAGALEEWPEPEEENE